MSVGTTLMIAIPVAAFMGPVAMIVGSPPQPCCNHFGHGRPMIAIPAADDCGSLHLFGHRNSDNLVPRLKGKITSGTILVSGEAVTAELEMTVDSTMGGKKTLGMTR